MRDSHKGFNLIAVGIGLVVFIAVAAAGLYVSRNDSDVGESTAPLDAASQSDLEHVFTLDVPKKGAHFETSTPMHASILAAVPAGVVLNFNFDLADNSTIRIEKDGKDYSTGSIGFDSNRLTMRRQMDKAAPDGVYTVKYNGCWPDRTCHDGHFQFVIDRKMVEGYTDNRNQKNVTVKMSLLKFQPMKMRITTGTTVTWVNDDAVDHYVNTDSHPAHTHVANFNSRAIGPGGSYSYTFKDIGSHPYHCSAHAADMTGSIVVE